MSLTNLIDTILATSHLFKYILLFFAVIAEGPFATMLSGILSAQGYMNIFLSYLIVLTADMISDSIYYAIGWLSKEKSQGRIGKYFKLDSPAVNRARRTFQNHPRKALVIGKLTHIAGVPILLAAGSLKIRFGTFFLYDFLATVPKSLAFIFIGFYIGYLTNPINKFLEYGTISVFVLIFIVLLYLFTGKYLEKKYLDKQIKNS